MLETLRRLRGKARFYNAVLPSALAIPDTRGKRTDGVQTEEPLRRGQGGSYLVSNELPGVLRALRLFGRSLQPRIAPAAEPLRDPQGRENRRRQPRAACSRQPHDPPRLGLGSRLRRGDLENASVRPPRRLRCCFGRLPLARGIRGDGIREVGLNWRDHVDYDSSLVRSSKIMCSLGDPSKAAQSSTGARLSKGVLSWPRKQL